MFVDDEEMANLNALYLGREGPTNVLAFPQLEGDHPETTRELLGDVVISADTAAAEAEEAGISVEQRVFELMVHGILHLVGYDHGEETEAGEMEARADELAHLFGRG